MKQFLKNFCALRFVKSQRIDDFPIDEMELKHSDPEIPHFSDSIYFTGLSETGISFVTRMSFRNKKSNENWLKVHIPGEGVWGFENREMKEGVGFEQGKLNFKCELPGKIWRIQFNGQLFQGKKYYQVELDLLYKSPFPNVDFDNGGLSSDQLAFQLAKQPWNEDLLVKLMTVRRRHYEQAGSISGTITWKRKKQKIEMQAFRTHSFGVQNWKQWERHFWFTGLLEDGRVLHCGVVDFEFVKNLKSGYMCDRKKMKSLVKMPDFKDIDYKSGSSSDFSFMVNDGKVNRKVEVQMKESFPFLMDDIYTIRQAKSSFEFEGVKGLGICEMGLKSNKAIRKTD